MILLKFVKHIQPFTLIALVYYIAIFLLKTFDTFSLLTTTEASAHFIGTAFMYNYIASSLLLVVLLIIYSIISIFSKRFATIFTTIFASLFLIFEIASYVYISKCEMLLGAEVLFRPMLEILPTIISSVGIWFYIFIILSAGLIVLLPFLILKWNEKLPNIASYIVFAIGIIGLIFTWKLPQYEQKLDSSQKECFVVHKLYYFITDCKKTLIDNENLYDENTMMPIETKKLQDFVSTYSNRHVPNNLYPLEHYSIDEKNVLSHYFEKSSTRPNIVIIIAESLGREWCKKYPIDASFTPFLDSLASKSLYWSNCLSTTNRSFGAMPAITGSLPLGTKGFQFGNMPNHLSLLSILKDNGYQTNAFYASDFSFDAIQEYLTKQDIDYMSSNLRHEYNVQKIPNSGTYWGYDDEHLFKRSLEILQEQKKEPYCNIYTTISAHDNLTSENKLFDYFLQKVQNNIVKLSDEEQKEISRYEKRLAAHMYSDYAIQQFFYKYAKLPEFKNTIFIITGDHSSELHIKNQLGLYHVPLIIYSPLLKQTAEFESVVSHLDITPSLLQLLKNDYQLNLPTLVHWIGDGLDTASHFVAAKNILFMDYAHDIDEILVGKYFYQKSKNTIYEIDENLNFTLVEDTCLTKNLDETLEDFKYVNRYVYLNNRVSSVKKTIEKSTIIYQEKIPFLECHPAEKAETKYERQYYLLPNQKINVTEATQNITISCTAEICIAGESPDEIGKEKWIDKQMILTFCCQKENKPKELFSDKIVKFATDENITINRWYPINIRKTFAVESGSTIQLSLYVRTPTHFQYWTPNNHLQLRNIQVTVEEN